MSKFFVQFMLSVMIGISAAVGFNPNAGAELQQVVREARNLVQGTAQAAFKTVSDLFSDTAVTMDASAESNATSNSSSADVQQNLLLKNTGNLNLDSTPALNLDGTFSANARTKTDAKTENGDLSLTEKLKSTLDLDFGFGN